MPSAPTVHVFQLLIPLPYLTRACRAFAGLESLPRLLEGALQIPISVKATHLMRTRIVADGGYLATRQLP
jgi:hypothetical protein